MVEDDVTAALPFGGESGGARWTEGATKHDEARTSCSGKGVAAWACLCDEGD